MTAALLLLAFALGGAFGLLLFVVLLHAASEGDGRLVPPARRRAAEKRRLDQVNETEGDTA